MAQATLPTPSQVAQQYLDELSLLKPGIDVASTDSDWWIRSRVVGSVAAGVYADLQLIANDAFPQSARHDALGAWLQTLFGNTENDGTFLPATQSQGSASVTGNPGQIVSAGLQATYAPNGNIYAVQTTTQLDPIAGTGMVPFQSVAVGQSQNLLGGATITFSSPPGGLNASAIVASGGFSDARDGETDAEASARILQRLQNGITIGRAIDYEQYAEEADPSVTSAVAVRAWDGPGTVGVYITSGTTDIDTALNNGIPINVLPSEQLIQTVQDYIAANGQVLTDDVTVLAPSVLTVAVTGYVHYANGTGSTIPSNQLTINGSVQTLTQDQLVKREIQRAIYKTPTGGRKLGTSGGFVVLSDIEQQLDSALSAEPTETGTIPILSDRRVLFLAASGPNLTVGSNQVVVPGTITLIDF